MDKGENGAVLGPLMRVGIHMLGALSGRIRMHRCVVVVVVNDVFGVVVGIVGPVSISG